MSGRTGAAGILVVLAAAAAPLRAEEWVVLGARAQGMGGAGVAVIDDAHAAYWNPGAFAFHRGTVQVAADFSVQVSAEGEILETVDEITDLIDAMQWETSLSDKIDNGDPLDPDTETRQLLDLFVNTVPRLNEPGQGLMGVLQGGVAVGYQNFIISGIWTMHGGADPELDLLTLALSQDVDAATRISNIVGAGAPHGGDFTNAGSQGLADAIAASTSFTQNQAEELVYQAELAGVDTSNPELAQVLTTIAQATDTGSTSVTQNDTGVILSGVWLREYALTYSYPVIPGMLGVGVNVKLTEGETFYRFLRYDEIEDGTDIEEELEDEENRETSEVFAADVGVLFKPVPNLRVGVVARNVNAPEFDFRGPGDYEVEAQYRAGVAFSPMPNWVLAADVDVIENETDALEGFESRHLSVGTEYKLLGAVALRGGLYQNVESDESGPVYTLGLGIDLPNFRLDVAGAMSADEVTIETGDDSEELRERYAVSVNATLVF